MVIYPKFILKGLNTSIYDNTVPQALASSCEKPKKICRHLDKKQPKLTY